MAIIDQRHHFNASSVAGVYQQWADRIARINHSRARRGEPSLHLADRSDELVAPAYVNHSRWVADCPVCGAGAITWPDHPRACCLGCGTVFRVRHPSKARIAEALPLLLERPDPATRNWDHDTRARDPKHLDTARWADETGHADGWESARRLRSENRLIGGLQGDGRGDERDLIISTHSMTRGGRLNTGNIEIPPALPEVDR